MGNGQASFQLTGNAKRAKSTYHHNWMFDRLLVASSSPSDRAMFAMVGQHRMGNGTFAPCCIKVLIFLKLKDLVAKCRRTSWGLRMGGVGCQLLIMQTFPRSRCIFTPGVRILWRYAGLYKHAVQSSNMSQTDFKAKKILSELFSWNYLRCQNLRNFCRFWYIQIPCYHHLQNKM